MALYNVAEVILKPIFGSLNDRIGAKPVIVTGLAALALASLFGTLGTTPLIVGLARLRQGAAASGYSSAFTTPGARYWPVLRDPGFQTVLCRFGRYSRSLRRRQDTDLMSSGVVPA